MKKQKKNGKKILITILGVTLILAIMYFATAVYFKDRFYYGTAINCISVSGKTEEEANSQLAAEQENYVLELQEKNGVKEKIIAKEIGLKYTLNDEVKTLKNNQNPLTWIKGFFYKNDHSLKTSTEYDKNLLKKRIDSLSCFDDKKVVQPKDAYLKYNGKTYEIEKEIDGDKINKEVLYDNILKAIDEGKTSINLEKTQCYYKPKYTDKSKDVIEASNTLNKYLASQITYNLDEHTEIIGGTRINEWLSVDESFKVKIDEEKVREYIEGIARNYDIIGKSVDFKTSDGKMIKVNDHNYRKIINRNKESEALILALKEGKIETRQPISSIISTPEIGSTYLEVDLTKQCVSLYKDSTLVVKGDIVTGNVSSGNSTPEGVYKIQYKQKDAVLRGQGYEAPVSYWMPFNGGIGIHDANWRTVFGGEIYKTAGSHGCVNAPYNVAETIFNNIDSGTAVICHY